MFTTRNNLPENTRREITQMLQRQLGSSIDLMQQAKQAHWNVKGMNFIALHKLFDSIHEEVAECGDLIAERISQLGGIAEGTCQAAAKNSSLPEYPLSVTDESDHVDLLALSLAAYGKSLRQAIEEGAKWNDPATLDILTEISRTADKNLWLVEAHFSAGKKSAVVGVA